MPKKISKEFKERAVLLSNELGSCKKAAEKLGCSPAAIRDWKYGFMKHGDVEKGRSHKKKEQPEPVPAPVKAICIKPGDCEYQELKNLQHENDILRGKVEKLNKKVEMLRAYIIYRIEQGHWDNE